jgi:general secretion pathway protein L
VSEALVLIGGAGPADVMAWARVSVDDGAVLDQGLVEARASVPAAAPSRTVLVIPGADAQVKRVDLPARTEPQARAGAALMFEGALAAPTGVHYAVGATQDEAGLRLVAAMASARLAAWLERCRGFGAEPHHCYLDFTIWPVAPGDVEIAASDERAIVAAGAAGGFSIEPALALSVFARWFAQTTGAVREIRVAGANAQEWAARLASLGPPVTAAPAPDFVATLARGAVGAPDYAPNLRQGEFAAAPPAASPWRIWRFAAALALIALLLQVAAVTFAGVRDHTAAAQIMTKAEQDFRAARPDVHTIVNLRAQVAAMVNAVRQSSSHPVLAASDPLIRVLQARALVRLDELRHQAPGRTVRLTLSAPQPQLLEQAAGDLRDQGLSVEARSLEPRGGRYITELVLESP